MIGVKEGKEEEERERESEKPTILGQFSRADLSLDEEVVFGNEEVGGEEVRSGGVVDTGQCGVLVGTTRRLTELHHMDRGRETDRWSRKRGRERGEVTLNTNSSWMLSSMVVPSSFISFRWETANGSVFPSRLAIRHTHTHTLLSCC